MNRKIRSESVLLQLSEEQREILYDWLLVDSYPAVQARLAAAPPEGFGLKAHITSLRRFFKKRNQEGCNEELLEDADGGEDVDEAKTVRAAQKSLARRAYDLASSGQSLKEFGEAARCLGTIKELELKEGYLRIAEEHLRLATVQAELEREKFETNTARLALEHAAELNEVMNDSKLDDEDKIRQSRRVVFTRIPEDGVKKLPGQNENPGAAI